MRTSLRHATVALGIVMCAAAGCDRFTDPGSDDILPPPAAPEPPTVQDVGTAAAAPTAGEAGGDAPGSVADAKSDTAAEPTANAKPLDRIAFFSVAQKGWVALTDEGFAEVPTKGTGGGLSHGARRYGDRLIGPSYGGWLEFRADGIHTASDIPKPEGSMLRGWAVGPDDSLWTLAPGKVAHLEDGAWTSSEIDAELPGDVLYTGMAIDKDGEPWVATGKVVLRRKDGAWAPVSFPGSQQAIFLQGLGHSPSGDIYLPYRGKLMRLGDAPTKVKLKSAGYASFSGVSFATAADGTTYGLAHASNGASLFVPEGKKRFVRSKKGLNLDFVTRSAIDARGRVWLSGDAGLAVADLDGNMTQYPSGSVELIAGKLHGLIVVGEGPDLPKVSGELATGTLKGNIMRDGEAFADAKVEICPRPSTFFSRTPCTGESPRFKGKTDAEGNFVFADVPLGSYGVAIKTGRSWRLSLIPDLGAHMKADETYDVGTLRVDTKKD